MKKAVLVFAHKDSYLLNTLIVQLLSEGETDVYIHLDKKSEGLRKEIICDENVFFIKNNVSVSWGDDSMMRCLFASWDEIYSRGKNYDYFIMCTGQDLLIRKGLDKYLSENNGKIFLDAKGNRDYTYRCYLTQTYPRFLCRDLSKCPKMHPLKIMRYIYSRFMIHSLLPKKPINVNTQKMTFFYSFNWSVFPYEVFKYCEENVLCNKDYRKLYYNTYLPEDGFLATLIMNTPFAKDVQWIDEERSKSLTYHSVFTVHPKIFTMSDVTELDGTDCFFARKFDSKIDVNVINYYKNKIIQK